MWRNINGYTITATHLTTQILAHRLHPWETVLVHSGFCTCTAVQESRIVDVDLWMAG